MRTSSFVLVSAVAGTLLLAGCSGGGGGTKTAVSTPSVSAAVTSGPRPGGETDVAPTTVAADAIRDVRLADDPAVKALVAETAGTFTQGDVTYADLTGDGVQEAVVPISSGGTLGDLGFVVLSPLASGTRVLFRTASTGGGGLSVRVDGGILIMTEALPAADDPQCCPSQLRVTTFAWQDGALKPVTSETIANPAGGGKGTPAGGDPTPGPTSAGGRYVP